MYCCNYNIQNISNINLKIKELQIPYKHVDSIDMSIKRIDFFKKMSGTKIRELRSYYYDLGLIL